MRSVPTNPNGQPVQWKSPEEARATGAAIGGAVGVGLGSTAWYALAKTHPAMKYIGVVLPLAGGYFGYLGWRALLTDTRAPAR